MASTLTSAAFFGATVLTSRYRSLRASVPKPIVKPNWVRTVHGEGRGWHVGGMVKWRGTYYICFVEGTGHVSDDSRIGISSSTDLENWHTQIVTDSTYIDPQLLPVGDTLYLYSVRYDLHTKTETGSPSWEMMSSTTDGKRWSKPKRCFLKNHDFWHPTEHQGRYYIACDNTGHVAAGPDCRSDLLTSGDGKSWTWVSEILHGSSQSGYSKTLTEDKPYHDTRENRYFAPRTASETALHFLDDGRLLAITRARGLMACLSLAEPPYTEWKHALSATSRCYGSAIARVGDHVVVTGRYNGDQDPKGLYEINGAATGVFLYKEPDISLYALLPSGRDTGYAAILEYTKNEALIAYYSSHEYAPNPGSSVYLASLPLP